MKTTATKQPAWAVGQALRTTRSMYLASRCNAYHVCEGDWTWLPAETRVELLRGGDNARDRWLVRATGSRGDWYGWCYTDDLEPIPGPTLFD